MQAAGTKPFDPACRKISILSGDSPITPKTRPDGFLGVWLVKIGPETHFECRPNKTIPQDSDFHASGTKTIRFGKG
jgi:hypothetical protein